MVDADAALAELEDQRPQHAGPRAQVVAALVALGLGVFGAVIASGFGLGSMTQPGPGLWPLTVSLIVVALSATLLIVGRRATDAEQFTRSSRLIVIGVATLVAWAILLPVIGFEVPSLLLMFVWLRWLGRESWRSSVVVSIAAVAAFYVLFIVLLQIPLPRLI